MGFDDIDVQTGGKYLRLNDGDYANIHILCKSPKVAKVHGYGKDTKNCIGQGCPICVESSEDDTKKVRQRFSINILNRQDNKIQIFEFGPGIASDIKEIAITLKEMGQTIHDVDLRIKRNKEGGKVNYRVIQLPKAGQVDKYFENFTEFTEDIKNIDDSQVPF